MPRYRSPAKVNLWLRILGRREDGFHDVDTRMCPLDLHDDVEIDQTDGTGIEISCSDPEVPTDEGNLVWGAARSYLEEAGMSGGLRIHLEKRIPSGAGLAGGSGNAATVLRALDGMRERPLGLARLTPLAAAIGSDVVFFLHGGACDCTGRGEIVTPVPEGGPSLHLLLVKPDFGVSTPWAYGALRDSVELPGVDYTPQALPWGEMVNDLERPVFSRHLVLAEMKGWLRQQPGVAGALMSGSGSTMFAVLKDEERGPELQEAARERYGESAWVQLCRTVG